MADVDTPFDLIDLFRQGAKWNKPDGTLTEEAITQLENITAYQNQSFERIGGSTDIIQEITNSETFETSGIGAEFQEISDDNEQIEDLIPLSGPDWEAKVAKNDCVAVDRDFIEVRNSSTVKMDSNASHNDQIIVGNGDGSTIKIDGNGVQLRYKGKRANSLNVRSEGTFIHFYKFVTENEEYWRAS